MSGSENIKNVAIGNEHNVTAKDIINEADRIYKKVIHGYKDIDVKKPKHGCPSITDDKEANEKIDALYNKIRSEHKDFASSYPTVLRHMAQERWYDHDAFVKYMRELEKSPWTNDEQRMDSYTRYAELLLRETNKNKHMNNTTIAAFKRDYRRRLQEEHDTFMRDYKAIGDKVAAEEAEIDKAKRAGLISAFQRIAKVAGVEDEKIKQVNQLIESGLLKTNVLEAMVYDLRRAIAGTPIEEIRREYAEHNERVATVNANTKVLSEGVPDEQMEKIKQTINDVKKE